MKKLILILLTFVLAMSFMTGCSAAEQSTETTEKFVLTMQIGNPVMTVNGEEKNIDDNGTIPVVESGRTLVPIRAIIEAMGGDVKWTYISPAADFQADGEKTGKYILAGEDFTLNANGESIISYADYAIAMVDEIEKGNHICERIGVVKE